jgi:hypothetical protein
MPNKKAAVELSIGTIVIIVLAMSMLIMGLVLIRGIFSGATNNVDTINKKVEDEINKLFVDESKRAVLKLSKNTAEVKLGESFGVAFGVRNTDEGITESSTFMFDTVLDYDDVREKCGVTKEVAESWITHGSGDLSVRPGEIKHDIIRIGLPESAPLCVPRYRILIYRPGIETPASPYDSLFFFLEIKPKGLF